MDKIIYPAVGHCIYCGAREYEPGRGSKLHEEHIIQFSLNGNLVLPEASCRKCEKETHKYEGVVARTLFGNFRMRHNLWTRRPKDRPKHIKINTKLSDGTQGTADIPVAEYPAPVFPYTFEKAAILRGKLVTDFPNPNFATLSVAISEKEQMDRLVQEHLWDGIVRIRIVSIDLARMLAKAAFSYAIAILRPDSFRVHPLLLDIILNRTENAQFLVGGEAERPPPQPNAGHLLQVGFNGIVPNVYVIVSIRLFASLEMPVYHVVVGNIDFQNPQHVNTLTEKLNNQEPVEFSLPLPEIGP